MEEMGTGHGGHCGAPALVGEVGGRGPLCLAKVLPARTVTLFLIVLIAIFIES